MNLHENLSCRILYLGWLLQHAECSRNWGGVSWQGLRFFYLKNLWLGSQFRSVLASGYRVSPWYWEREAAGCAPSSAEV